MMPYLTIFTAPKPFKDPHISLIQRNAIQSWTKLGDEVEVLMLGEEEGMAQVAADIGVRHIPDVRVNDHGTPLVSSLFDVAREQGNSPYLAYVNADILLMPDVVEATRTTASKFDDFLMVGQRWDLSVTEPMDFSGDWVSRLKDTCALDGRLHPRGGSDYFIFPRSCFTDIPDFAIGRAGWDNWMIYEARRQHWPTVDTTGAMQIIHQDHDYRHLPKGQPHYRMPETKENIHMAGGKRTIFTLMDTNRQVVGGEMKPAPMSWAKFWREVEIFPLVGLRSYALGQLSYGVFHPMKAYRELRAWMRERGSQRSES